MRAKNQPEPESFNIIYPSSKEPQDFGETQQQLCLHTPGHDKYDEGSSVALAGENNWEIKVVSSAASLIHPG